MKFKLLAFFLPILAVTSCVDIPDFEDTPKIYYNGITQYSENDSINGDREIVVITVDVEDGDGDLGASSEEINNEEFRDRYAQVPGWGIPANYELVTMRKRADGSWDEGILGLDSLKFFPIMKVDGKPGPVKVKLDLITTFPRSRSSKPVTCKFKVRIIDRAFHISNPLKEGTTDEVIVPSWD